MDLCRLSSNCFRRLRIQVSSCDRALEAVGKKKWNRRVREVLAQVQPIFNPDRIYLGGGNAKHLRGALPKNVKVTENLAGLLGGIALWKY